MREFTLAELSNLAAEIKEHHGPLLQVGKRLSQPHPLVNQAKNSLHAARAGSSEFLSTGENQLNIRVTRPCVPRALLLFDAFIKLAEARGHRIIASEYTTQVVIEEIPLQLSLREVTKVVDTPKTNSWESRTLAPTGRLCFSYYHLYPQKEWMDTKTIRLEDKLHQVMAYLELTARDELAWQAECAAERKMAEQQKAERERLQAKREEELSNYQALCAQARRWAQYQEVTRWIEVVKNADLHSADWIKWAEQKAAWLDPRSETEDEILGPYDLE